MLCLGGMEVSQWPMTTTDAVEETLKIFRKRTFSRSFERVVEDLGLIVTLAHSRSLSLSSYQDMGFYVQEYVQHS